MKKQGLPILLIFLMLITPIDSAFDHCAGMNMSAHLSEIQSISVTLSADDAIPLDHKKMIKGLLSNSANMDCQTSDNCTVHVCGGYGITSSIPTINTVPSSYYSVFEYSSPYTTDLSPDLRPPIFIL